MKIAIDSKENLCDICEVGGYTSPECGDDIALEFGDGLGNDNVIGCSVFEETGGEPDSGWARAEEGEERMEKESNLRLFS